MRLTEEELIVLSSKGEISAFEQLVNRYERKVYSIAYRFMGSPEDAADMAQEAFLRLFKSLGKFRGESSFTTWLYHVVANVCRDELRRRGKLTLVSAENALDAEAAPLTPEGMVIEREEREYLHNLILNLPDDYRVVIVMREIMGFSYEEIAQVLNCSLGTVKSRLSRSRRLLRDRILEDKVFPVGAVKGGNGK